MVGLAGVIVAVSTTGAVLVAGRRCRCAEKSSKVTMTGALVAPMPR